MDEVSAPTGRSLFLHAFRFYQRAAEAGDQRRPGKLAARLLQRALSLRQIETRAAQQIDSSRSDLPDNPRHVQLTRRGDESARLVGCLDCKGPRRLARCRDEELLPQGAGGPGELAHGAGEHERWLRSLTQQGDAGPGQHPGVPHGQVDLTRGLEERLDPGALTPPGRGEARCLKSDIERLREAAHEVIDAPSLDQRPLGGRLVTGGQGVGDCLQRAGQCAKDRPGHLGH
jgi:hypothetical protein